MNAIARIAAVAVLAIASHIALAQGRTIDFTQPLIGLDGTAIRQSTPDSPVATLGWTISLAFRSSIPGDDANDWDKKLDLYELVKRCYNNKACQLKETEVTTIRTRVGKLFGAEMVGAVAAALEKK